MGWKGSSTARICSILACFRNFVTPSISVGRQWCMAQLHGHTSRTSVPTPSTRRRSGCRFKKCAAPLARQILRSCARTTGREQNPLILRCAVPEDESGLHEGLTVNGDDYPTGLAVIAVSKWEAMESNSPTFPLFLGPFPCRRGFRRFWGTGGHELGLYPTLLVLAACGQLPPSRGAGMGTFHSFLHIKKAVRLGNPRMIAEGWREGKHVCAKTSQGSAGGVIQS